jgi:hypothetical protein
MVEKKQLSEDLCYKRNKTTMSFIYFDYKMHVKDIERKYPSL